MKKFSVIGFFLQILCLFAVSDKNNAIVIGENANNNCTTLGQMRQKACSNQFEVALTPTYFNEMMFSWAKVEEHCKNFQTYKNCLGEKVVKDCAKATTLSDQGPMMAFGNATFVLSERYLCNSTYNKDLKVAYDYADKHCVIDSTSCETAQSSIDQCLNVNGTEDDESKKHLQILLHLRVCNDRSKKCVFCPTVTAKVMEFLKPFFQTFAVNNAAKNMRPVIRFESSEEEAIESVASETSAEFESSEEWFEYAAVSDNDQVAEEIRKIDEKYGYPNRVF